MACLKTLYLTILSKLLKKKNFKFRNRKIKCYDIVVIWKYMFSNN